MFLSALRGGVARGARSAGAGLRSTPCVRLGAGLAHHARAVASRGALAPSPALAHGPQGSASGMSGVAGVAPGAAAADPGAAAAPELNGRGPVGGGARLLSTCSQLSKARLSGLVVTSTALGFLMAGPPVALPALAAVSVGTALASASAATFNQMYECSNDGLMARTRMRPLPAGRVSMAGAGVFGVATGVAGVGLLAAACNPLTAALGAANIFLYAGVYTPMKQWSPANTVLGSVVGAIPPVMGWAAATGSALDPTAAALFSLLFLWQMPHFYALAWRFREDYARGGFRMISLGDAGGSATGARILGYSAALAALPFACTAAGITGFMFAVESVALNAYFLPLAYRFYKEPTDASARKVFLASLWYLPVLMLAMAFHSTAWKRQEEEAEEAAAAAAAETSRERRNITLSLTPESRAAKEVAAGARPYHLWTTLTGSWSSSRGEDRSAVGAASTTATPVAAVATAPAVTTTTAHGTGASASTDPSVVREPVPSLGSFGVGEEADRVQRWRRQLEAAVLQTRHRLREYCVHELFKVDRTKKDGAESTPLAASGSPSAPTALSTSSLDSALQTASTTGSVISPASASVSASIPSPSSSSSSSLSASASVSPRSPDGASASTAEAGDEARKSARQACPVVVAEEKGAEVVRAVDALASRTAASSTEAATR